MHAALTKLGKLPGDTLVWNGHEYTKGSAKFGLTIEPDNEKLKGYAPFHSDFVSSAD
jgi:hydroxyacylglutathione hydrolase